jgi:ubiquinone/menaquinone biosynthesis C-methylase UbiE
LGFISPLLRLFFRLLYGKFAWTYDFVAAFVSGGRWIEWTRSVTGFIQGPRILELGFGPGHLLLTLLNEGHQAFGLDSSPQMLRMAQKKFANVMSRPGLVYGVGQSLPFAGAKFNNVVSTFPTAYIFQADTLAEINRILVPGGTLVILLSAWITDRSLISRFLAWLFRITGQVPPDNFDVNNLLSPFRAAGFIAQTRWVELPTSRLLFVVSHKTP